MDVRGWSLGAVAKKEGHAVSSESGSKQMRFLMISGMTVILMASAAKSYQTENVFIVVIDGIRDTEAFDDTSHAHIPNLWNNLRP